MPQFLGYSLTLCCMKQVASNPVDGRIIQIRPCTWLPLTFQPSIINFDQVLHLKRLALSMQSVLPF